MRKVVWLALASLLQVPSMGPAAAASTVTIATPGSPITRLHFGADLGCQAFLTGDVAVFEPPIDGPADCGTFIAVDGELFGPDLGAHADTRTTLRPRPYRQIQHPTLTGSGAPTDPFRVETIVAAHDLIVRQNDVYSEDDQINTSVTIENHGGTTVQLVMTRAGDCHLGVETGTGYTVEDPPAPGCRSTPAPDPGQAMRWAASPQGHAYAGEADGLWESLASGGPLPTRCACTEGSDTAAGISVVTDLEPGNGLMIRGGFRAAAVPERSSVVAQMILPIPKLSGGAQPRMAAELRDARGTGIDARLVRFLADGVELCRDLTLGGIAVCDGDATTALLLRGTTTFRAVFDGDAEYLGSEDRGSLLRVGGEDLPPTRSTRRAG